MNIGPTNLHGHITPPSSKSISHRALIFASLAEPGTEIYNILPSEDVEATREGLLRMGAEFEELENGYRVIKTIYQGTPIINCGNSGTTMRLLTGLASLFPETTVLLGDESLNSRPMGPLVDALTQLGASISTEGGTPPVEISQPVKDYLKHCSIRGDESSQYISSLLILAAFRGAGRSTIIELIPPVVSKPYIELTLQMLMELGVSVAKKANRYLVEGTPQLDQFHLAVPTDFSSAAFFIVAGALPGNHTVIEQISFDYHQADAKVIEVVRAAGAEVNISGNRIEVIGQELQAFEVDLVDSPDLFPILSVLAANARGTSRLFNAKHLRIKETDRIKTMVSNLREVGIAVTELEDGAKIKGGTISGGVELKSYGDHRIAMAAAILATRATGSIRIDNPDCVAVSYPTFFDDLANLYTNEN